jgi:hypothetical protein
MHSTDFMLLLLAGCFENSPATTCKPDVELLGYPGEIQLDSLVVRGEKPVERCLLLDASANDATVTFLASDLGLLVEFALELRSLDGQSLATDDGAGLLRWTMPPGPKVHCTLAAVSSEDVEIRLTLQLSELPAQ